MGSNPTPGNVNFCSFPRFPQCFQVHIPDLKPVFCRKKCLIFVGSHYKPSFPALRRQCSRKPVLGRGIQTEALRGALLLANFLQMYRRKKQVPFFLSRPLSPLPTPFPPFPFLFFSFSPSKGNLFTCILSKMCTI